MLSRTNKRGLCDKSQHGMRMGALAKDFEKYKLTIPGIIE